MFNKRLRSNISKLDEEIGTILEQLSNTDVSADDYQKLIHKLDNLSKIRNGMEDDLHKSKIKSEIISGAVSLVAVIAVLKYEERDVITTKAFGIATKMFRG